MTKQVHINKLHLLALQLSEQVTEEEEIMKRNITELYYDEKPKMLKAGELINAQFHGLPGSGKSTAMLAEIWHTNKLLGKKTSIDHVLPNQIVYIQVMRRITRRMDACIGIDEFDELGETGYNATTDKAGLNSYSDLGRAYYIHRYTCSPKDTMDKNAYLIFEVIGADKIHKFTRCLLRYKLFKGGIEQEVLLGYVDIDVSKILDTQFYKDYENRKMQRLRLFSEYGIIHERHIFFAKVLLDAYKELVDIARNGKVERGMAELQIDMSARKLRMVNSILGTNKFANDLISLLQYTVYQEKERDFIRKMEKLAVTGDVEQQGRAQSAVKIHKKVLKQLIEQEQKVLEYWEKAKKLEPIYISNFGVEKHETTREEHS